MSQVSISGAVSGIDTASLINSLVSVQQNQQTLLKTQQSQQQKAVDTLGGLISSLGKLSTKAKALTDTSAWKGASAASSSNYTLAWAYVLGAILLGLIFYGVTAAIEQRAGRG